MFWCTNASIKSKHILWFEWGWMEDWVSEPWSAPCRKKTVLLHIENILGSICRSTDATRQNHNAPIIVNEAARSRYRVFADYNGRVWFSRVAWWVSLVVLLLSISVIWHLCVEPVAHVRCGAICFCAVWGYARNCTITIMFCVFAR